MADSKSKGQPKSPGQKYRHYSPQAKVSICVYPQYIVPSDDSAYIGLEPPPRAEAFKKILICKSVEDYARSLFQFFRECDDDDIQTIFCQSVSDEGLGLALMDRLERASHE